MNHRHLTKTTKVQDQQPTSIMAQDLVDLTENVAHLPNGYLMTMASLERQTTLLPWKSLM